MLELKQITAKILNIEISDINDKLSRVNSQIWDSFKHLLLVSEIEKVLGVSFTIDDVKRIKTFKQLSDYVKERIE